MKDRGLKLKLVEEKISRARCKIDDWMKEKLEGSSQEIIETRAGFERDYTELLKWEAIKRRVEREVLDELENEL
jgi:hypothetical protein